MKAERNPKAAHWKHVDRAGTADPTTTYDTEDLIMTATKKTAPASSRSANSNARRKPSNDSMLKEFFIESLQDIYWAEKHIAKALPKMAKAATSPELAQAFTDHKVMTESQAERLEQVFELLGEKAKGKKCAAMEGILAEGEEIISDTEEGTATRDVGLIMAGQKVEHYEIASYGGLAQLARTLGFDDVAELLEITLEEEKQTDLLLTDVAENDINYQAASEAA